MVAVADAPPILVRCHAELGAEVERLDALIAEHEAEVARVHADRRRYVDAMKALNVGPNARVEREVARAPKQDQAARRSRAKAGPTIRDRILAAIDQLGGTATARRIAQLTGIPLPTVASKLTEIKREEGILANDRALSTWSLVKRPSTPPTLAVAPDPEPAAIAA